MANKKQSIGEDTPLPVNRMMTRRMVKVRAVIHIGENGYHQPGEIFEVDAERRPALGKLVEDVSD